MYISTEWTEYYRLFLQLSELGLPHPLMHPQASVYRTPTSVRGGGGGLRSLAWAGGGGVPIPTRGQTLWYPRCT
jgi:hypothetical protein